MGKQAKKDSDVLDCVSSSSIVESSFSKSSSSWSESSKYSATLLPFVFGDVLRSVVAGVAEVPSAKFELNTLKVC